MSTQNDVKEDKRDLPYCKYEVPCRAPILEAEEQFKRGRIPHYYECLPRETTYAFMPAAYYATGFNILPVYKREVDFAQFKNLFFLEDPDEQVTAKWKDLRRRIPFPVGRVIDLPGTRDMKYKNYCVSYLTPESKALWRKSIRKSRLDNSPNDDKNELCVAECAVHHTEAVRYKCNYPECPFKSTKAGNYSNFPHEKKINCPGCQFQKPQNEYPGCCRVQQNI